MRMFELMYATPDSETELDVVKREATQLGGGVLLRMRQFNRFALLAIDSPQSVDGLFGLLAVAAYVSL